VAVTTSVIDPREDFEINALGTFNLLEAIRESKLDPAIIFTSTNKVYGCIEDAVVVEHKDRYVYRDYPEGMDESRPLDFHSPYGCSKGAADQYVRDYARTYGMRSVVFRMSCQYGIRQFGNEDQGWVVHFVIASQFGKDINIYGDGKQVRDLLYIDDLVRAFRMATKQIDDIKGNIFNIGGGPDNVMSLLELVMMLEEMSNRKINLRFSGWRPGDQQVYVSKICKAKAAFGWEPTISKRQGLKKLCEWVQANEHLFEI
jgi:CDP-paratose 2-epimerase